MPTEFSPLASTAGGILIGVSALWMMAALGRIAGISGLLGRLLPPDAATGESRRISIGFIAGLLLAPVVMLLFGESVVQTVSLDLVLMAVAGLLVGVGTAVGSGCTSGHGVCGLSRLSVRSLAATVTFMLAAGITVYVVRHVMGAGA